MKHFLLLADEKTKGATPPVCKCSAPCERTAAPPEVDCPGCIDWMAKNYKAVIAQVEQLRRSAA